MRHPISCCRLAFVAAVTIATLLLAACGSKADRTIAPPPPPQATKLGFLTSGITAQSGSALTIQVAAQDANGSTIATTAGTVTLTITPSTGAPGATLGGTLTQSLVNGIASFSDINIDKAAQSYTLTASSSGLANAVSGTFAVAPGPPSKLTFSAQPGTVAALTAIAPGVQVTIQDAAGNTTAATAAVTLAITNGTGAANAVLGGTKMQAAVNGVATFADLTLDKVGTGYTLSASSPSLTGTTSAAFQVDPGAAAKLAFSAQPSTVTSMVLMNPAVQVLVQDAAGNTVTSSAATVTLAITNGTGTTGAVLGGALAKVAANGVATFDNLTVDKAGSSYSLTATASGLTAAPSTVFNVNAGAASKLSFTTQPATVAQGATLSPAVQVLVTDAGGNSVTTSTASIAVAVTPGTGTAGAVLGGTLTRTAAGGAATFNDLAVDRPGSGFSLTATSSGLAGAVSSTFAVNGGTISGSITLVSTLLSTQLSQVAAQGDVLASRQKVPFLTSRGGAPSINASFTLRSKSNRFVRAAPLARAFAQGSLTEQPEFTPDELIVTFKPSASLRLPSARAMSALSLRDVNTRMRAHARLLADANGATLEGASPAIRAVRLKVADAGAIETVKAALERDSTVARVERSVRVFSHVHSSPYSRAYSTGALGHAPSPLPPPPNQVLPTDPDFVGQSWHYLMADLDYAWAITTGSSSVIVAVVDDGIRFDHPDIAANLTSDGYDFVSTTVVPLCGGGSVDLAGDGNGPDPDPTKPNDYVRNTTPTCYSPNPGIGNHGLHVAGTIGAVGSNGLGGTGINWSVKIRPVRVLNSAGSGNDFDVAQGILYAAGLPVDIGGGTIVQAPSPARVINLSLGGPVGSLDLQNAVAAAVSNGVAVVASAGNSASNTPSYPAAFPEVISVSAVGPDATLASYSNFGPTVDIAAPGGDFADGNASYGVYSTVWDFASNKPTYEFFQGTSMAAPHVSGVAALLIAQNPALSPLEVRARLQSYAVDIGPAGPDTQYGAGLLNARNSLTQSFGLPHSTRARLYSQTNGAMAAEVAVAGNGSYTFSQVPAGTYWVFGAQDENGDGQFGLPRRRWSALGGTATPTSVAIAGTASQAASFSLGFAIEHEPNDAPANADVLVVGGHLLGFASSMEADVSTILVPSAGQYVFETQGYHGSCGFALELDTILELYDANGVLLASNDDINLNGFDFCSRIVTTLAPGRYYLRVHGYETIPRRYYLTARRN